LPVEFIIMAKVIDSRGFEKIYRGEELERFLGDPNRTQGIAEARVILDVRRIRTTLIEVITVFFHDLKVLIDALPLHPEE
jgi:hypothetical protein